MAKLQLTLKIFVPSLALCIASFITLHVAKANKGVAQDTERIIETQNVPNMPLKLVDVSIGDQSIISNSVIEFSRNGYEKSNIRFKAPDVWLKDLKFKLKNTSDKTITRIDAEISVSNPALPARYIVRLVSYLNDGTKLGPSANLPPAAEVTLTVGDEGYNKVLNQLKIHNATNPVLSARFDVGVVYLDNGQTVKDGYVFQTAPNNKQRWNRIDLPMAKDNSSILKPVMYTKPAQQGLCDTNGAYQENYCNTSHDCYIRDYFPIQYGYYKPYSSYEECQAEIGYSCNQSYFVVRLYFDGSCVP
jgi:hypothetical protein